MLEKLPMPAAHDGAAWPHAMPAPIHPRHRHAELELNLVLAGTGRYLVENRSYGLKPGALLWLFPGQEHILLDMSAGYRMWILVFRPRLLRRVCRDARRRVLCEPAPAGDFCRQLSDAARGRLDHRFQELPACADDAARLNAGLACALLESWEAFLTADAPADAADLHPAVRKAAQLLRTAPDNADLAALARQAGLSRTRLSELFHRQTGVALVDFRRRLRLERFAELSARAPEKTRLANALDAGFGSYQQFYRVFKRHYGRAPGGRAEKPAAAARSKTGRELRR